MPRSRAPIIVSLLLLGLCGCTKPDDVVIHFDARLGGEPVSCGAEAGTGRMTDLRFYVADVHVTFDDGSERPLTMVPDGLWQDGEVALIDLEDGTGDCLNGSPAINRRLSGTVPADSGEIRGLRFTLGVPEALNHADPMRAGPPLNNTIMHWHWRSGYKFLRAGVATETDAAWLHLGSSQCSGTIGRIEGCRAPNRVTVELDSFDPAAQQVAVDLERLFAPSDLGDAIVWDCQSGPGEEQCSAVFAALGLRFEDGAQVGPTAVFSAVPMP